MLTGRDRFDGFCLRVTPACLADRGPGEDDNRRAGSTGGNGKLFGMKWLTWNSGSLGVGTFWLYELDGRSMGVEMAKDGVWAGVCCPLARGVDQASRKWLC
jgi:hypothetical protein